MSLQKNRKLFPCFRDEIFYKIQGEPKFCILVGLYISSLRLHLFLWANLIRLGRCLHWKCIRYLDVIIASLHVVSAIKSNLEVIGTLSRFYGVLVPRNFVDLVFSDSSNPFKG